MPSVRGNPQIDAEVKKLVSQAIGEVKSKAKNLDDKTLADIASDLHAGLAVTEKYKGVRQTQRTAVAGGRRRRRSSGQEP